MNTQQTMPAAVKGAESLALLPRINVHVFCDSPQMAQTMQAVSADRRMSRAHMEIYSGGIPAAAQYYMQTATPQLLVVESAKERDGLLADLGALAQVCSPETKVIVLGHVNDISFYHLLISQGISDYLAAPLSPQQILSAFSSLFQNPEASSLGRVITFMGSKGGVGSSVIAHNVAWLLARQGAGTVIAYLDLAFGTAGLDFNVDPAQGILDALSSKDRLDGVFIDRLLTKCSERLLLLASPSSVDRVTDIQGETLEIILDLLRDSNPHTIVDLPTTWENWMKVAVAQTDVMVIVATPELASLRNTKSLVDNMKSIRPNDAPPLLVLNQVEMNKRPEIPVAEFARAAGLEVSFIIPFDAQTFGQAMTNGQMITEVAPRSKAAEVLQALTETILGGEVNTENKKKSSSLLAPLLSKLAKKGGKGK